MVIQTDVQTVWIVDDDEAMCGAIQLLLEDQYSVRYFLNFKSLDQTLSKECPDLLILDLKFGMDESAGLEYLKCFRKSHPYLPVVVCSVRDDVEAGLIAGNNRVTRYVIKQPDGSFSSSLLENVEEALSESVLNEEIARILEDEHYFERMTGKSFKNLDPVTTMAIRCFLEHITETGPSVEKLAEMTGYCVSTLNNHFHSSFRQPVGDFITYLAVLIGCRIILRGYSVSKASAYIGMSSERFRQRVQAVFGKPPREIVEADFTWLR